MPDLRNRRYHLKQSLSLGIMLTVWLNCLCLSGYSSGRSETARIRVRNQATGTTDQQHTKLAPKTGSQTKASPVSSETAQASERRSISDAYGNLPLSFEVNRGQSDPRVKFLSRGSGYGLFLTPTEAVMAFNKPASGNPEKDVRGKRGKQSKTSSVLRMSLAGANTHPRVTGLDELSGRNNYFMGQDSRKWRTDVPAYSRVKYEEVYPGVDVVYYGSQRQLEHDFILSPGADPRMIKLNFDGIQRLRIDAEGNLLLKLSGGEAQQSKPIAYQDIDGRRQEIACSYTITGSHQAAFKVGEYDAAHPLIIDPVLSYSTYLGGVGNEWGYGIAVDASGNAYITGFTNSTDFPISNAAQPTHGGGPAAAPYDVFVTKLNPAGTAIIYSTYLGGSWDDRANAIAVDDSGNAYVTGLTGSLNFPLMNAYKGTTNGSLEAFITKLSPSGSTLLYSTYFGGGGSDQGRGIAVDSLGDAYITGVTDNVIPTSNAFQPTRGNNNNAFVTKFNSTGMSLVYSTYLGGDGNDEGNAIAVDSSGDAYVTGLTDSTNFPMVNALQPNKGATSDVFVTKLDATGMNAVYSTYLGGNGDDCGYGVATDASGNAYLTGYTISTNFPTANAVQPNFTSNKEAFVTKYNPAGSALVYSTYLGGTGIDEGRGIAVGPTGSAYVTGKTTSGDFPAVDSLPVMGGNMSFVTRYSEAGTELVYSTFIDGSNADDAFAIAVDSEGSAYITGITGSTNFPTLNPIQPLRGSYDVFVTKIDGRPRFKISGRLLDALGNSISFATVNLSGTQTGTTQTAANGSYSFFNLAPGGNYAVTPSQSPYTFVPSSQSFNNLTDNQTADFSVLTYTISGRITDASGNGIEAAMVAADGFQTTSAQTDADGYYSLPNLTAGGDYTVTPTKSDPIFTYSFAPLNQSFTGLSSNGTANFTSSTTIIDKLYPAADAYVQDGTSASINFGTATPLIVRTDSKTNNGLNRDAYFKFDLSGVDKNFTSVKLRLYAALSAAGSVSTSAYSVSDINWIESGTGSITWTNKPVRSTTAITGATVSVNSTTYAYYDLDITSYIRSEKNAGRDTLSLALHNPSASTLHINLNSREAAANKPQLVITKNNTSNAAPTASITSPANGVTLASPANINISASASDTDGTIAKVEFFAGTTLIGTSTASPYQITWSNVAAGSYSLTAVATDDRQTATASSAVNVTVNPANSPPAVSITSPLSGATYPFASNLTLSANASDGDGSVSKVEFFTGTTLIGTATTPSPAGIYSVSWNNIASGAHSLTAKATDNTGTVTTSSAVSINVVSLTALAPAADAYVKDGTTASTNFGTATELQSQVSATAGSNRETHLRFNLATVGGVVNARLRLYGRLSDATGSNVPAAVYPVSNTTWVESGTGSITWTTKPVSGASPLAAATVTNNTAGWYEWDVTSYIQSEKNAGRNLVSLSVKNTTASSPFTTFNSREAAANRPQLVLWTTQPRNALLVVGSATLNTGDSGAKTRLESLGYTVTVKAAGSTTNTAVNTTDADGKSLVVISSTVTPANVAAKFRHVPIPVVIWEFDLLDDQGMTGLTSGTDYGTTATQTQASIVNSSHPMAANLSGTIALVTAASTFTWGKPNANAVKIATLTTDATKVVIFGYDNGIAMPGMEAPARRVSLFMTDTTAASLTAGGGALFDAAIKWAAETMTVPIINALSPAAGDNGASVTITGNNFGTVQGSSTVTFNGVTGAPTSWSNKSIVVAVPSYATTGMVLVKVSGVSSNGVMFTIGATDADGDGLPDAWEMQYFGNLNQGANADPDGDGLTNLQEYQQGRNPIKNSIPDTGAGVNLKVHTPLNPPLP